MAKKKEAKKKNAGTKKKAEIASVYPPTSGVASFQLDNAGYAVYLTNTGALDRWKYR